MTKESNNKTTFDLKHMLHDIKQCLDNDIMLAALFLCISLPDVCGKVAFPNEKGNKKRYKKWFETYCDNFFNPFPKCDDDKSLLFDAEICYQLRCSLLHSGKKEVASIDNFNLVFDKMDKNNFVFLSHPESNSSKAEMNINVRFLCEVLFTIAAKYVIDFESQ